MTVEYQKVWRTMNDLEMVTSKIVSAREIIDTAAEAIQKNDYDKAETLAMAAYEFLEYYLQEFDDKFKLAWQATVGDLRDGNKSIQYTEEELDAMCDKAELDAELDQIRKDGGYEWTPAVENPFTTDIGTVTQNGVTYTEYVKAQIEASSAWNDGWTKEHYQKIVDKYEGKQKEVKKWVLPVEEAKDMDTDKTEYFVSFPQDLLETANLKEGDEIKWVDNGDGTFTIVKVTKPLGPDEC